MKTFCAVSFLFSALYTLAQPTSRSVNAGLLSLPLAPSHRVDELVEPIILHQQHINRGIQRLLLTQGQPLLSNADLLQRLLHRIDVSSLFLRNKQVQRDHLDIQAEDVGYYGPLQIGTPPKTFQLLMDSGSADLWVGAEDCQCDDGGSCGPHQFLGPESSATFSASDETWSVWYGTGAVSGVLVRDQVSISGATVNQHAFGVAQNESSDFVGKDIPFDGILGLAQSEASRQLTPTFLDALKANGHVDQGIASYKIPRQKDGKNDGELILGGLNPDKYDSSYMVTVNSMNERGFWEVPIDDVKVNGVSLGFSNISAILDTGATLFMAQPHYISEMHKSIPRSRYHQEGGAWILPCNTSASISVTIGGKDFPINPLDIAWVPLNDEGECLSGLSESDVVIEGVETWLLGDVFLKNVYFSTNQDTKQVTLARLL